MKGLKFKSKNSVSSAFFPDLGNTAPNPGRATDPGNTAPNPGRATDSENIAPNPGRATDSGTTA